MASGSIGGLGPSDSWQAGRTIQSIGPGGRISESDSAISPWREDRTTPYDAPLREQEPSHRIID
jgi:hypothetical protein